MSSEGLKLGVNVDHVATLRQARGEEYPDVLEAAKICEASGAEGITVHLREDRRHIQDEDVYSLKENINIILNLEMANSAEIVKIALDVLPDEVCIVPEKREELTTEGGLDVVGSYSDLKKNVKMLSDAGIDVSLFIDPDDDQIKASADLGVPFVELHTGCFCNASGGVAEFELERLTRGADLASDLGMRVNAGHGLNLENVEGIFCMKHLHTLNIGHSIVARAVFVGLECAVKEMIDKMAGYKRVGEYV